MRRFRSTSSRIASLARRPRSSSGMPSTICSAWCKHFEDDRIRTLFTSYMHVITTESVPGAGIVFSLIFANVMEFTLPVGGSASFTDALARVIEACGGSVITGADVKAVVVRNGRATGVRLADGGAVEGSRFIASAIDAPTTMRMAGEDLFPEDVRKKLNAWHWGNHSPVDAPPCAARQAGLSLRRIRF